MTDRVDRIAAKLAALRQMDANRDVFGAESHQYRLNPPVTSETLASVEAAIRQPLPSDYREFITRVGDGGAGPFYGLLALNDNDGQTVQQDKAFPYTPDCPMRLDDNPEWVELTERADAAFEGGDRDAAKVAADAQNALFETLVTRATNGIKFLAAEGCGMYDVLVVNGPQAGTVWFFDFCNDVGVLPINHPVTGQPMGFAGWYEYWLDVSLADLSAVPSWFDED